MSTKKKFAFKSCKAAWPGLTFKKSFWYEFCTNTKKISNQKVIFNKYSVLISIKFYVVCRTAYVLFTLSVFVCA
jgi:hypothetical protein